MTDIWPDLPAVVWLREALTVTPSLRAPPWLLRTVRPTGPHCYVVQGGLEKMFLNGGQPATPHVVAGAGLRQPSSPSLWAVRGACDFGTTYLMNWVGRQGGRMICAYYCLNTFSLFPLIFHRGRKRES